MDTRQHWENNLPLTHQQLLVMARILLAKPRFVFLDRPGATLSPEQIDWVLDLLRERGITYVTFTENGTGLERYDAVLELPGGGVWAFKPPGQELLPGSVTEIIS